jgi:hypothetical protein
VFQCCDVSKFQKTPKELITGVYILENNPPPPPPEGGGNKYGLGEKNIIKTTHAPTKKEKKKEITREKKRKVTK